MICHVCSVDHKYPNDILKYGDHYICKTCILGVSRCEVCRKRRLGLNNGICESCMPVLRQTPLPHNIDTNINTQYNYDEENDEEDYKYCTHCLRKTKNKEGLCEDCIKYKGTCSDCGSIVHKDGLTHIDDIKKVCRKCLRNYKTCTKCETIKKYVEQGICMDCRHSLGVGIEFSWRYKPPKFFPHGDTRVMFGVENEVQLYRGLSRISFLSRIAKSFHPSVAYTMYDGTIDYGTEVIFHPHSFEALKRLDIRPHLRGTVDSETTGMHVHISRSGFVSKVHLYKFMRFISENPDFIEKIARRKPTHQGWRFTKKEGLINKARGGDGYGVDYDKYVDINLKHEETVEVRIFKGATTKAAFYKNLEFCHALLYYSKHSIAKDMTDVCKFAKYVFKYAKKYPNLSTTLRRMRYTNE